jgi:hypothetical protein
MTAQPTYGPPRLPRSATKASRHPVRWGYFIQPGIQPDCPTGSMGCHAVHQQASTPGIWNPLPRFTTVRTDGQLGNIQGVRRFFADASTRVDAYGYGLRVPGLVISPYARRPRRDGHDPAGQVLADADVCPHGRSRSRLAFEARSAQR